MQHSSNKVAEGNTSELPCKHKLAFDSLERARAEATASEWRHGTKLKTYQCRHCGLYHLATDYGD